MMRDQRDQPLVPPPVTEVQRAIQRVEAVSVSGGAYPMSCSHAAAISTERSSTGTVTVSSVARSATPWVWPHRSGQGPSKRDLATRRACSKSADYQVPTSLTVRRHHPTT